MKKVYSNRAGLSDPSGSPRLLRIWKELPDVKGIPKLEITSYEICLISKRNRGTDEERA